MKILALDLSLTTAGVCRCFGVVAGQEVYQTETVKVAPLRVPGARPETFKNETRDGAARLAWWHDWLVEEIASGVETVAMENFAYNAKFGVAAIAKLQGIIELVCYQRGIPFACVPPASIKKFATGMGKADKQRMIDTAVERFGEQVQDEHQADAAWLCAYVAEKGL